MHSSAPANSTSRCIYTSLRDYLETNNTHKMMLIDTYTNENRAREKIHVQKKSRVCTAKSASEFLSWRKP